MYDVIVIGLGGMGSAAAQHLAARGKRVLGLEQFMPVHDLGSSHGSSRIFRQSYWEDPAYVPLLLRSHELWTSLEKKTATTVLHTTGGLYIGACDSELVRGSLNTAVNNQLPHDLLDAGQIKKKFPFFTPGTEDVGVLEHRAGYLDPDKCVSLQLAEAARNGAELSFHEKVLEWKATSSRAVVKTEKATYEADRLIISSGAWAPQLLREAKLPLTVTRQVLFWFEPEGSIDPFSPQRCPVYVFEAKHGRDPIYGFPATEGRSGGVKVAIHGSPEVCTPETINRNMEEEDLVRIREKLSHSIPALGKKLLKTKTCMYTMTPDEHFIVGHHPEFSSVMIAAGFSGHGFKFANVIGEILADLAMHDVTHFDLHMFSPRRFSHREQDKDRPMHELPGFSPAIVS